jgi:HlyD family secretion protein
MTAFATFLPNTARTEDPTDRDFALKGRLLTAGALGLVLFGGLGGWLVMAPLSSAVIGIGTVAVDQQIKTVQHPDGGVVSDILVQPGDHVKQGQTLLQIDGAELVSRHSILQAEQAELLARAARLTAERDGATELDLPPALLAEMPGLASIVLSETRALQDAQARLAAEYDRLTLQIDQAEATRASLSLRLESAQTQLGLLREEVARVETLMKKGVVERTRGETLVREVAAREGEVAVLTSDLGAEEIRQRELELARSMLTAEATAVAHRELREIEPRLAALQHEIAAIERRLERTAVVAPVDGIVNEQFVHTVGGVVNPAEDLVTIVPADAEMTIEFRISRADIDQISPGQPARLRFSAFNQRTTPEINGKVVQVSPAATTDERTGEEYFVARAVATDDLSILGPRGLVPGMPVEVYVTTAERSALAYLAQPIVDQMNRTFREE